MAQTTIEIFEEKRITYKGKDPDLNISCVKEDETGIVVEVKINLRRHNFGDNCDVFFQTYDNRGAGNKPNKMGKIKELNQEEKNVFQYPISNIKKEDAKFRVIVSEPGNFKDSKVIRLIGKAEIPGFDDENDKSKQKINSLLPTKELDIGTPFMVDMSPNRLPYLVLKRGCNIKYKLDSNSDPIQKSLIYTSAIRAIIEAYLTDHRYEDCIYKKQWFDLISKKTGESVDEFPSNYVSIDDGKTVIESNCKNWIESVTETMVSNLPDSNGKKLIDKHKEANFRNNEITYSEEEG